MKSWISLMIRKRRWVIGICLLFTIGVMTQIGHLAIVLTSDSMMPQSNHYVLVGNEIEKTFGNKYTVVVGVTATQGTIYQKPILEKIQRITSRIMKIPGVIKGNVIGIAARKSKSIVGTKEGMIVRPLMEKVPENETEMKALIAGVGSNPVYENLLVSKDQKTTQIVAEFSESPSGFSPRAKELRAAIAPELDSSVDITLGGLTVILAQLENFSARMAFFFPLAVLIIGLIHYEAFRTVQALALPLVTAIIAVIWSLAFFSILKIPMDVFNATTPILILAIAAGHAVQILKRYYEEFSKAKEAYPSKSPKELNELAVLNALSKVGPVMVIACVAAALGFLSLLVFEIKSIRVFGMLTAFGILSTLILELTFIPALRSALRPPSEKEYRREKERTLWDRMIESIFHLVSKKRWVISVGVMVFLGCVSLGGYLLKIENSQKSYFSGKTGIMQDDDKMNSRMAGTNTINILVDGGAEDAIKNPKVLEAMEKVQEHLAQDPKVGKTLSIVDFIKRMNQAMNGDKKEFYKIPSSQDLVAQFLLLYSNSGEPGDFDSYVDYGYRKADIIVFQKSDKSLELERLAKDIQAYADSVFPPGIKVQIGGGIMSSVALNDEMVRGKILNILQILGCVFLISSLVFRSPLAGILILVPLVATIFANFGFMGLLGIPLNIPTSLVAAMAVGVGADYAIYLSFRIREELRSNLPEDEAIRRAFLSAGKATIFVSSAIAGGFGTLVLSWGFMIHIWMGILIAIAMLVSSFSTLTVFSSLLLTLRPKFIFEKKAKARGVLATNPFFIFLAAAGLGFLALNQAAWADSPAEQIAKKSFLASKVADSTADSTFHLLNASGEERLRETTGETKLLPGTTDNRRLVVFLAPADVRGTKTLLIEHTGKDDDIWIYLPAMKKVRRLVSSNKKDSFVGTDFSYGDVIGHKVEDWNHKVLKEEPVDGKDCYVIESTPKRPEIEDNTGYSKRVSWIDKESYVALRSEIYDLNGELLKKLTQENVQLVDAKSNKWQPMRLVAENVQTGHKTIIEFKNFKANTGVKDEVFTSRYLEK